MRALTCIIPLLFLIVVGCRQENNSPDWPTVTNQQKPWTRWWWHGSAVTKEGITVELEAYAKAGLGGVEITPIYGVHGFEEQFVPYLSPKWIELLVHTLKEADRLGLGVDMATGTGWPFGGPWVSDADACKNIFHKVYTLSEGQSLKEKIMFIQPPFLRAVGSQVYEVHDNAGPEGRVVAGTRKEPLQKFDPANIKIEQLKQPVSANEDLQSLALDQVQYERPLPLQALVAYGPDSQTINLTTSVDTDGNLTWTAPEGEWKLYALFEGWHGKMVERAAPGGEGNVIDHFSSEALANYLAALDSALSGVDLKSLRSFFNDSYEVDDARGAADWTPTIVESFNARRGYSLLEHLPALFGEQTSEDSERILYDYRLTIHELLLENFTRRWAQWAHDKGKLVRNQAHGAPANILDLYASVDIPETEGVEPLRIRMATSAGHVTGKKLISSESATWLDEHFLSGLGDIKANVDRYLVNGVNHVLYHGTTYSPPGEPWPGWLFYAAVHLNPRNPQWSDFAALNRYIARCQSMLQQGLPDNDVLLYYPISDRFSHRGPEMVEHFDSPVTAFKGSAFMNAADSLLLHGYSFDFISDLQLSQLQFNSGKLMSSGGSEYKTIVIPQCKYIPIETIQKLLSLADDGASIVFYGGVPGSASGYSNLTSNEELFAKHMAALSAKSTVGNTLTGLLKSVGVAAERMVAQGISLTKRKLPNGHSLYFLVNSGAETFQGWLPLANKAKSIVIRDPMTGRTGDAKVKSTEDGTSVLLKLYSGQTLILELDHQVNSPYGFPSQTEDTLLSINSGWTLEFISGGPTLPGPVALDSLRVWTSLTGTGFGTFSGTASYSTTFKKPPGSAGGWMIDLGEVHGTATVFVNGDSLATLMGAPYEMWLADESLSLSNDLRIDVSNLMANRISELDRQGVGWKKFYNVNFPARKSENRRNGIFYSGDWLPLKSGLSGPVTIAPARSLE